MSHGGSEPSGLCGLRKQVTEAKEEPLELRRKKGKHSSRGSREGKVWVTSRALWGRRRWGNVWAAQREEPFVLRVLSAFQRWGFQGWSQEDVNRKFISFLGVSPARVMVSTCLLYTSDAADDQGLV